MRTIYVTATFSVLLLVLPACTDLSQAPDPVWAEADFQAVAQHSIAGSRTHDFERALMLAADHEH